MREELEYTVDSLFWVIKESFWDPTVSFNIASEASYVYILNEQKLIKKCQKSSNLASFWNPKACVKQSYQTGKF